jgi:hypothetical protein
LADPHSALNILNPGSDAISTSNKASVNNTPANKTVSSIIPNKTSTAARIEQSQVNGKSNNVSISDRISSSSNNLNSNNNGPVPLQSLNNANNLNTVKNNQVSNQASERSPAVQRSNKISNQNGHHQSSNSNNKHHHNHHHHHGHHQHNNKNYDSGADENCFDLDVGDVLLRDEFDFEKNLAMFDKDEFYERVEGHSRPVQPHQPATQSVKRKDSPIDQILKSIHNNMNNGVSNGSSTEVQLSIK